MPSRTDQKKKKPRKKKEKEMWLNVPGKLNYSKMAFQIF